MTNDYYKIELKGKHGEIDLMVPTRKPTQQEIDEFYHGIAEIAIDEYKRKMRKKKVENDKK